MTTVNRINADYPLEVYRFLRDEVGTEWIQLIPIVECLDSAEVKVIRAKAEVEALAAWFGEAGDSTRVGEGDLNSGSTGSRRVPFGGV